MSHAKIIINVIAGGRLLFRCCKGERQAGGAFLSMLGREGG